MNLSSFSHLIFDFDSTLAKLLIDWTDWHTGTEKIVKEFDENFAKNVGIKFLHVNKIDS